MRGTCSASSTSTCRRADQGVFQQRRISCPLLTARPCKSMHSSPAACTCTGLQPGQVTGGRTWSSARGRSKPGAPTSSSGITYLQAHKSLFSLRRTPCSADHPPQMLGAHFSGSTYGRSTESLIRPCSHVSCSRQTEHARHRRQAPLARPAASPHDCTVHRCAAQRTRPGSTLTSPPSTDRSKENLGTSVKATCAAAGTAGAQGAQGEDGTDLTRARLPAGQTGDSEEEQTRRQPT